MMNKLYGPSFFFLLSVLLHPQLTLARNPTQADRALCDHYAQVMQQGLEVQRSGNPNAIVKFRQSVIADPQADLMLRGLGVAVSTPSRIKDVTDQSRTHCLDEVRYDMRGYLPGDPESAEQVESHVGTITRLPSK